MDPPSGSCWAHLVLPPFALPPVCAFSEASPAWPLLGCDLLFIGESQGERISNVELPNAAMELLVSRRFRYYGKISVALDKHVPVHDFRSYGYCG